MANEMCICLDVLADFESYKLEILKLNQKVTRKTIELVKI